MLVEWLIQQNVLFWFCLTCYLQVGLMVADRANVLQQQTFGTGMGWGDYLSIIFIWPIFFIVALIQLILRGK